MSQTHTEVIARDYMSNLQITRSLGILLNGLGDKYLNFVLVRFCYNTSVPNCDAKAKTLLKVKPILLTGEF